MKFIVVVSLSMMLLAGMAITYAFVDGATDADHTKTFAGAQYDLSMGPSDPARVPQHRRADSNNLIDGPATVHSLHLYSSVPNSIGFSSGSHLPFTSTAVLAANGPGANPSGNIGSNETLAYSGSGATAIDQGFGRPLTFGFSQGFGNSSAAGSASRSAAANLLPTDTEANRGHGSMVLDAGSMGELTSPSVTSPSVLTDLGHPGTPSQRSEAASGSDGAPGSGTGLNEGSAKPAPEMSWASATGGLALLFGALVVMRSRRRLHISV